MNEDLKLIKKYYGEEMMHYARDTFSSILEQPGKLSKLFIDNFDTNKYLYEDLKKIDELPKFKSYIYNIFYNNKYSTEIETDKSPQELLGEVGYDLYECKTESDIQSFKKYYSKNEELCTFNGNRLDKCYVFFAVKKNVKDIKRENFKNPERQDEYGTSVISIQFSKDDTHSLSIKNRYNHTVKDCDATFKNNLDNIIPGLTYSFDKHYGMKQKFKNTNVFTRFIRANDGKYYKYNYEQNGIYFCQNNVLVEYGTPKKLDKEKYIILDTYVLDLQNKTFLNFNYDDDYFKNTIENIKKIEIKKKDYNKLIIFKTDKNDIIIEINKYGEIIGYINNNIEVIKDNFMRMNNTLEYLKMNNVKEIGDNCLLFNRNIEKIELNSVESIGESFNEFSGSKLKIIDFPKLKYVGEKFMSYLSSVEIINLPEILCLSNEFLSNSRANISYFNIPKCKIIENEVLICPCVNLNNAHFDSLEVIGDKFLLFSNSDNNTLNMPNVRKIKDDVLKFEKNLKYINLPNLLSVGKEFLMVNKTIRILNIDKLSYLGKGSLSSFLKSIRNNNTLSPSELIDAIKIKSKKLEKIQELRELKNKIIQCIYTKKKELIK